MNRAHYIWLLLLVTSVGCSDAASSPSRGAEAPVDGKADRYDKAPELDLIAEFSLEDLLDHPDTSRFEASGVAIRDGRVLIVFDNLRRFASLDLELGDPQWLGDANGYGLDEDPRVKEPDDFAGFEGIAIDWDGTISLAVEAMRTKDKEVLPVVVYWSEDESTLEWLDYEVAALNKGVEGLGYLEVEGQRWMAALCETGKCDDRNRGRLILRDESGEISYVNLPKGLDFIDFSGLAIEGDRVAVVSQESSRVWVGNAYFDADDDLKFETQGVYNLPRQRDGDVDFCTVEGVAWLGTDTLIAVSDLQKAGQHKRCKNHAERLHFLGIPD